MAGGGTLKQQRKAGRGEEKMEKERMPGTVWFALKKSLHCKSEPSDVYDPKARRSQHHLGSILTRKPPRSGCSRSIANLKDVIHGSKRHLEKPPSCSPRSIGSSEFLNPITHEVILSNSRCELRITGFGACPDGDHHPSYVGTLRPGTPGPGGHHYSLQSCPSYRGAPNTTPPRKCFTASSVSSSLLPADGGGTHHAAAAPTQRGSHEPEPQLQAKRPSSGLTCHKCGEPFGKLEALESHHLSNHAVTELAEGDSSRKIVEIICRASWVKAENSSIRIERVLKVHNTQKTLARFEDYREAVKAKASKLAKKHPRCLADGNELLRFHGTTIACGLGAGGSSTLCSSDKCNVCRIVRNGFSTSKKEDVVRGGGVGVFTTSTSGRAFEAIGDAGEEDGGGKKALLVCRVVAGRVHRPLDNYQELARQTGFDSVAGKVGLYANIEELYLLNPRALLPCFVVICKT
ncbi:uncharacterized protein LOC122056223 isoform X1 [Zingiber officinale]|uniref:C2H2-type domain-containing protein n=2 Tax=Zingiber officinale TaxID=94328 RepID=A0A8J5HIP1_ZINOF|nr:uncharacterized protein LOC122056223 isoform X1 [Zingiber officinale]KAG6517900.1 hypothetical protein ZIOFF_021299 [Zingiber officinale]